MGGGERWGEIQTKEPSEGKWQEKKIAPKETQEKKNHAEEGSHCGIKPV